MKASEGCVLFQLKNISHVITQITLYASVALDYRKTNDKLKGSIPITKIQDTLNCLNMP
jgi:hypothetical protein